MAVPEIVSWPCFARPPTILLDCVKVVEGGHDTGGHRAARTQADRWPAKTRAARATAKQLQPSVVLRDPRLFSVVKTCLRSCQALGRWLFQNPNFPQPTNSTAADGNARSSACAADQDHFVTCAVAPVRTKTDEAARSRTVPLQNVQTGIVVGDVHQPIISHKKIRGVADFWAAAPRA